MNETVFDEQSVRDAYAVVRQCFDVYSECVDRFREYGAKAQARVDGLVWHLPSPATGAVELAFVKGSSWAEAVVRLVLEIAERSKDWRTFEDADPETQGYMIRVLRSAPTDLEGIDSNLKIEAVRIRDRRGDPVARGSDGGRGPQRTSDDGDQRTPGRTSKRGIRGTAGRNCDRS